MCRDVRETQQRVLGLDHPDTLSSADTLANVLASLGRSRNDERQVCIQCRFLDHLTVIF